MREGHGEMDSKKPFWGAAILPPRANRRRLKRANLEDCKPTLGGESGCFSVQLVVAVLSLCNQAEAEAEAESGNVTSSRPWHSLL